MKEPAVQQEQRPAGPGRVGVAGPGPLRIAYLIRSLEVAGAERQLLELVRGLDRRAFAPTVLTYYPGGALEPELAAAGVPLVCLRKQGRWDALGFLRHLRATLRRLDPAIIHSYMTTANLFALAARSAVPRARLVWGIRQSDFVAGAYGFPLGPLLAGAFRLEQALAGRPDAVIANSEAAAGLLAAAGAPRAKLHAIPNGIDCSRFRPDRQAGAALRRAWGVPPEAPLIGQLARIDPMKGHAVFLEAAAIALRRRADLRFAFIGEARQPLTDALKRQAERLGIAERVVWAGARQDVAAALNALDLHCSASRFGEGFSNAVAEAMACGVPSVVTDVGDSAALVGDCGRVVPPGDAAALAEAWLALLALGSAQRQALAKACRERIETRYSSAAMVERTAAVYQALLGGAFVAGRAAAV